MFRTCLFRPLLGHIFFLAWSSPSYKNKNALRKDVINAVPPYFATSSVTLLISLTPIYAMISWSKQNDLGAIPNSASTVRNSLSRKSALTIFCFMDNLIIPIYWTYTIIDWICSYFDDILEISLFSFSRLLNLFVLFKSTISNDLRFR